MLNTQFVTMLRRSEAAIWLVGKPLSELTGSKLPSKREILAIFINRHRNETKGKTIRECATVLTVELLSFWNKARIPTKKKQHVITAIERLFNEWRKLCKNKENKTKRSVKIIEKEHVFEKSLNGLFDIAHQNALELIKIPEDREFLLAQREEGRRGKMGSVDANLARKEQRKADLEARKNQHRLARQEDLEMAYSLPCTSHEASSHVGLQTTLSSKRKVSEMSSEESESEDELDQLNIPKYVELERPEPKFIPEPWLVDTPRSKQKKPKPVIISPSVADSLDRTKTSDRSATYVLASTAQSLGHDVGKMTLSRQSIRRSRMKFRKITAERIKADFSPNHPLTIH